VFSLNFFFSNLGAGQITLNGKDMKKSLTKAILLIAQLDVNSIQKGG
jgi:hypothetical protein